MQQPEIIWRDPPPMKPRGGATRDDQRRKAMDAEPGRWLLWHVGPSLGAFTRLRKDGYEVTSRREDDGNWAIYARRPEGWKP